MHETTKKDLKRAWAAVAWTMGAGLGVGIFVASLMLPVMLVLWLFN